MNVHLYGLFKFALKLKLNLIVQPFFEKKKKKKKEEKRQLKRKKNNRWMEQMTFRLITNGRLHWKKWRQKCYWNDFQFLFWWIFFLWYSVFHIDMNEVKICSCADKALTRFRIFQRIWRRFSEKFSIWPKRKWRRSQKYILYLPY